MAQVEKTEESFDPDRVVAFPSLSLAAGAVKGWDRRNAYYFQLIASLAKHYRFEERLWRHVKDCCSEEPMPSELKERLLSLRTAL